MRNDEKVLLRLSETLYGRVKAYADGEDKTWSQEARELLNLALGLKDESKRK